jgi:lysophospholipase L1-like esterase
MEALFFSPKYHSAMAANALRDAQERRVLMLAAIGRCSSTLLRVPLVVVLSFGILLICGCSANNEGTIGSASEETTTTTVAPNYWNYVALGDSLAAGTGASYEGYVDRYAAYIEDDTGARVSVTNLGRNGQTSSELLYVLRNDSSWRRAVGEADVLTINIGINDLGRAVEAYENGTCGGTDHQNCLREAVQTVEDDWNAIVAELLGLRSISDTIIRSAGLGYTPFLDTEGVFKPYLGEVTSRIEKIASENGIPYIEAYLDRGHISQDGLHPNDEGYEVIAEQLRELGYNPLA